MHKNGKGLLKQRINRLTGLVLQSIKLSGSKSDTCCTTYVGQPFIEEIDARQLYSVDNALAYVTQAGDSTDDTTTLYNTVTPSIYSTTQVTSQTEKSHELVFIDRQVSDYETIVSDLASQQDQSRQLEVYFLNENQDGIQQISQILASLNNIDAVHIISHGNEGEIQLGNQSLNNQSINNYSDQLTGWANALTESADLLIYGCDVAGNTDGQALLKQLSTLTKTDIAASTDLTGHASLNGNWDLEYKVGNLETSVTLSKVFQAQWQQTLATASTTDFNINTSNTTDNQEIASQGSGSQKAIDMDANGNYVVVWSSLNQDGDGWGVYAQRYDASGVVQGGEIHVNSTRVIDDQRYASVAMDDSGNFVVTWTEIDTGSGYNIYARAFDNTATATTPVFNVNTESSGFHSNASIDIDKITGDFIIVWQSSNATSATDSDGVYFRRFSADGTPIDTSDKLAHADTGSATVEHDPVVAMLTNGKFVVGWDEGDLIYHRRFDATGTAIDPSKVSIDDGNLGKSTDLSISSNSSGSYIFSYRDTGIGNKIFIRGFDETGNTLLNTGGFTPAWASTADSTALNPSISLNDDGSFIVAYQNTGDGDGTGIFARKFDATGNATSSIFQINSVSTGSQVNAAISSLDSNNFVVAWSGEGINDPGGVFARQTGEVPFFIEVDTTDDTINDGDTSSILTLLSDKGSDGKISLREAITAANNTENGFYPDEIHFNLIGSTTINLTSALPDITDAIVIDGSSEPDYVDSPIVELNGISAGSSANGITLASGSDGSTIHGLTINRFSGGGIQINTSSDNKITGNYLGTDISGLVDQGNTQSGVIITDGSNNQIGGTISGEGNIISGNNAQGIEINGSISDNNSIQGNLIGISSDALTPLKNALTGISISDASNTMISGNTITAATSGIFLVNSVSGTTIQGNNIGTDATGTENIGGSVYGIGIQGNTPTDSVIGGINNGEANIIANWGVNGVYITSGTGHSIRGNSIYNNGQLGIELKPSAVGAGVTANDPDDSDTGPNNLQNYPVLTGAIKTGTNLRITGNLTSTVSTSFEIDFYASTTADPTNYGEAERYLDTVTLSTDPSGSLTFDETFTSITINAGEFITATATDINGNTSEFSQIQLVTSTNASPTFTSLSNPVDNTNEDVEVEISFATLLAASNASDDVSVDGFIIKAPSNGTLKIGTNAISATNWVATTNDRIDATLNAYWTPVENTIGTINAFDVVAIDNESVESSGNVTVQIAVTAVNDAPVITNNTLTLNQGDTVTLNSTILSAFDPETTNANTSFTLSGITNGHFAYSVSPATAITSFNQAEILAGDIIFVHDGGELAPAYTVSVTDGSLNDGPDAATINFTGTSTGVLWTSVSGNEGTSNGIPGLNSFDLNQDDILQQAGENFTLGAGTTDGEFSIAFDASKFATSPNINGMHYVSRPVTIGATNPVNLQAGDVLLSTKNTATFTSNGSSPPTDLSLNREDIFYFRPDQAGDYSTGNFYRLLDDIFTDGTNIHGLSLVETDTWVGDYQLKEGDLLISRSSPSFHSDILVLKTDTINTADNTSFPATITLLYGSDSDVGFDRQVQGLDVLENNTTIGGQSYAAGTLLITFDNDDDIDSGADVLTVSRNDIAALSVTKTNVPGPGNAEITASLLFDGDNVNFDAANETIDALSLTTTVTSSTNIATPTLVNNTLAINEAETVTITTGMISATDTDSSDAGLIFNVSSVTGGQFELFSNPGVAITAFTQSQITSLAIAFVDNGDEVPPTFDISVSDGGLTSSPVTGGVSFSNINDDPTGTGTLSATTLNDNIGPTNLFASLIVSDPDTGENDLSLRIVLSDPSAGAISGGGFSDQGGGVYTVNSLTVAQANAALSNAQFTPTDNTGTSGNFTVNIGVSVNDQGGGGNRTALSPTTVTINRVNNTPAITSNGGGTSNALSVAENQTAVTTVTASDADLPNDTLTYSISGGLDAGLFNIDSVTGVVSFKNAPNFESESDNNADNIYDIEVTVADNQGSTDTQTLAISVTDVYEDPATTITATGDSETIATNTPVVIDVLANDTDTDSLVMTVLDWDAPANGTIVNNQDGTLTYTPDNGFSGSDSFNYAVTNDADSTVNYWSLSGTALDAYNRNNGTVNGTTTGTGQYGDALFFNESTDFVQIPDITYNNEFTISFDFKIDDNSGTAYQYLYSHNGTSFQNSLNIFIGESANSNIADRNMLKVVINDSNDAVDPDSMRADISTIIGDGLWHTYTVTVSSSGGTKAFIDGSLVVSDSSRGGDSIDPLGDTYLGSRSDADPDRFYGGGLDSFRIFSSALSDGEVAALAATPLTVQASVNITITNAAPTLSSGPVSLGSTDEETISTGVQISTILAGLTTNDANGETLGIAINTVTGSGSWQYSTDSTDGTDGNWDNFVTVSNSNSLLLSDSSWVRYVPDTIDGENPDLTFRAWDGTTDTASTTSSPSTADAGTGGGSSAYSIGEGLATLTVTAVNDAPTFVNLNASPIFSEGGTPVALDSDVTVSDVELDALNTRLGDYSGTVLTLSRNSGANSEDIFGIVAGGNLAVSAGNITAGGNTIATFTNTGGQLQITFADNGTIPSTALVNETLQAVTYSNSNIVNPSANVLVDYLLSDGNSGAQGSGGAQQASGSVTVGIDGVNDAPVATNPNQTINYNEGDAIVAFGDIFVTDPDGNEIITAELTLADPSFGTLTTSGTATYDTISGLWSMTDSVANINSALANVAFTPVTDNEQDTSIAILIADGGEDGASPLSGTIALNVTPINDVPTATNLNQTISYTEGDTSVALNTIVVSDVDLSETITATLTLANPTHGILSASGAAIFNTGTGIWTLTDTLANVNAALASVTFNPATENDLGTTITTHIEDSSGTGPFNGSITLTVTPVNDAPTATNLNQTISYTEGGALVTLNAIVVSDIDSIETITATLTLENPSLGSLTTSGTATYSTITGIWAINDTLVNVNTALAGVSFSPTTDNDINTVITTHIEDTAGTGPSDGSISLNVTPINDTPTTTGISNLTVNEDALPTIVDLSSAFTDIEDGNNLTYSITNNDNAALFNSVITDSTSRTITFDHATNANGVANITVRATDSSSGFIETTFTLTVNPINDVATEVTLSNSVLLNGTDTTGGYSVGLLSTNDPDTGDIASFAITGGVDAGYFSISGINNNELIINADVLDSNLQAAYNIIVESTDLSGAIYSQSIEVTVTIDTLLDQLVIEPDSNNATDGQTISLSQDPSNTPVTEDTPTPEIELELTDPNEPPAGGSHSSQPPVTEETAEPEIQTTSEQDSETDNDSLSAMMAEEGDDENTDATIQAAVEDSQNKDINLDNTGDVQSSSKKFLADTYASGRNSVDTDPENLKSSLSHLQQSVDMAQFIDNMDQLRNEADNQSLLEDKIIGSSTLVTSGFSVGYIIWLVRGGVLMSSVLSSLPAWRFIDPLPIIGTTGFDNDEDDESLESIIESESEKVKQNIAANQSADNEQQNKTMDS